MIILRTMGRIFRLWPAWVVTVALLMVVQAVAPQQLPLIAYKGVFATLGAITGYWLHVWCFGHIGEDLDTMTMQHARWRRTAFMIGGMLAFALAA